MTDYTLAFSFLIDEEATAEAYGHQIKVYFPQRIVMLGCGVSWSVPVYDEDPHLLTYFMCVPASRQPVTEIPYTNIHSCLRKVGFRTPFVACTPTSTLRFCVLRSPVPECYCARSKPEVLGKVVVSFVAVLVLASCGIHTTWQRFCVLRPPVPN